MPLAAVAETIFSWEVEEIPNKGVKGSGYLRGDGISDLRVRAVSVKSKLECSI